MRGRRIGGYIVVALLAAMLLSLAAARPGGLATAQGAGALANAGLEEGGRYYEGIGELEVGKGWAPWWREGPGLKRPEFKMETRSTGRGRVADGEYAQKQFTTYSSHDAGIYQEVQVEAEACYRFEADVYVWSSNEDDPDRSVDDGKYSALVGINPWGDTKADYRTTVWGREALQAYNRWVHVEVTAQAWGPKIAVFSRGVAEWPVKHNDAYWDSFELTRVPCAGGPPATPWPTYTPAPISTPCPTAQPAEINYERIRAIVREELDSTGLVGRGSP